MDEYDLFGMGMGSNAIDPTLMQSAGINDNNNPYRYTGRYGTLMASYEIRSRIAARRELKQHMMRYEAQRLSAMARSVLNSGSQQLTAEQRQVFTDFANNGVTDAGIRALSLMDIKLPFDAINSAMGIEAGMRFMADPMTGMPRMDARRRAQIAAAVSVDLYRPGHGRAAAYGLTGDEMGQLANIMGRRGELGGAGRIEAEMSEFLRMRPEAMPGGKFGRPVGQVEAARLAEIEQLTTLRAATTDSTLNDEQMKNAVKTYEEALNKAVGKRIAQGLRDKAKSIQAVQQHFRTVEGEDIAIEEAFSIIEAVTGGSSRMGGGARQAVMNRLSMISQGTGMSMAQLVNAAQRGNQFASAFGMGNANLGSQIAIDAGGMITARTNLGLFGEGMQTFGIGSAEEEMLKSQYMGASFAGSGVNVAKMALLRLAKIAPEGLKAGRVKQIVDKLNAGQELTAEDSRLLSNPSALIAEMQAASPGLSAGRAQDMLESKYYAEEMAFYDPKSAMAGRADLQAAQINNELDKNLKGAVGQYASEGGAWASSLSTEDQQKAAAAVMDSFRQMDPAKIRLLSTATGQTIGIDTAKSALLDARKKGLINFADSELDRIAFAAYQQTESAIGSTREKMGYASNAEVLLNVNARTRRMAAREGMVAESLTRMENMSQAFAGEDSLTGVMALLEAADMGGEPVNMLQIGAAILSGVSDNEQAGIFRKEKDKLVAKLQKLRDVKAADAKSGKLTEEERNRLDDDIAVADAVIRKIDSVLSYDETAEGAPGKDAVSEYGPGAAGEKTIALNNVTLNINGKVVGTGMNGSGGGQYGGKNAVPVGQVG